MVDAAALPETIDMAIVGTGVIGLWPRLVQNWAIRLKAIPNLGYKSRNQASL
ncbi:MAG: hypothetical protein AAF959_16725 [Cyanobacteria bacterium P01_D01_bin.56]